MSITRSEWIERAARRFVTVEGTDEALAQQMAEHLLWVVGGDLISNPESEADEHMASTDGGSDQ